MLQPGGGGCPDELGEEERVDPDDGQTYTLRRLKRQFAEQYSEQDIEAYWRDAMRPLRRGPRFPLRECMMPLAVPLPQRSPRVEPPGAEEQKSSVGAIDYNDRRFHPDAGDQACTFREFLGRSKQGGSPRALGTDSGIPLGALWSYWLARGRPDESERRVDPEDGAAVTFAELSGRHLPEYGVQYLAVYWRAFCRPAEGPVPGAAVDADIERREDPADRQVVSWAELCEKYRRRYGGCYLRNYWRCMRRQGGR